MSNSTKENIKKNARIMTSLTGTAIFVIGGLIMYPAGQVGIGLIVMILGTVIVNNMALCGIEDRLDVMEKRLKKE